MRTFGICYDMFCVAACLSAEEQGRIRYHSGQERIQADKILRGVKQQLGYERNLKIDAFHQVADLLAEVRPRVDESGSHPWMMCNLSNTCLHSEIFFFYSNVRQSPRVIICV